MRIFILALLFTFPFGLLGQKEITLKKKYLGTYQGAIENFKFDTGKDVLDVNETDIRVSLTEDYIEVQVGRNFLKGTYDVLFETNKYYMLNCKMEGRMAGERIMVHKRGKHISRDGLYPQPTAHLDKIKD